MVSSGDLRPGDRLPTVRSVARELGVSSSTVADAWRVLARHGVINTARRNGTTVRAARAEMTGRFWKVPATTTGDTILDLSTGTPDIRLLPPLAPVIARLPTEIEITSYIDRPVLPALEDELHARWPFPAAAMTVVDGALDALDRLIGALVGFGDTVVVEDPTFPPILDMLERAGAEVIAVGVDEHGIDLDRLVPALAASPTLAILQPRAQNPTGVSITPERLDRIADAFRTHAPDTWIVEDNHYGDLAASSGLTLGARLPERVVHVHSFSKSHGPDLRIAAIGGAAEPVAELVDRRRLGPSWTSRLIQSILLNMLRDPLANDTVATAATEYRRRRQVISDGLAECGIDIGSAEGLNLWIPVGNEQRAVLALALDGIGVAPGAPFRLDATTANDHIRVSVGNARCDLEPVVAAIVSAAIR